jgi:HlyD family secretion protein
VQFEAQLVAKDALDQAREAHAVALARVRELRSRLDVSRLAARPDRIAAQAARVEAERAALAEARWRFERKQVAATAAGLVADTLYREGEWVPAGSPVVRLLPPANVKVRFFVAEAVAGSLAPGRSVSIRCDGCAAEVPATVSWVSVEAEYTPPVIYSKDTSAKLVFLVEARPAVADAPRLRPGQPVEVTLR